MSTATLIVTGLIIFLGLLLIGVLILFRGRAAEPIIRICCNAECGWMGKENDCVHPKHSPDDRLCPVCYEVTEEAIK